MQPRREPLLWLQCLALGAIPLELLLIRLVLAGADPGPVPGVERFLIWGVGVLAPAVALWRRPADWGSLLLVRQPLASRSKEQLRISASQSRLSSAAVAVAAVILLPALWWLDDSAVLASEFSPVSGQSRLVTMLLVSPLSALIVWQVQQLVQATQLLLVSKPTDGSADSAFPAEAVATQRTSLGLQLLNLAPLEWPEPVVKQSREAIVETADVDTSATADDNQDQDPDQDNNEPDQPNNEIADEATENETAEQDSTDINPTSSEDAVETEAKGAGQADEAVDIDASASDDYNEDLDEPETDQPNNEIADEATENETAEQDSTDINPTSSEDAVETEAKGAGQADEAVDIDASASDDYNEDLDEPETDQPNNEIADEAIGADSGEPETTELTPAIDQESEDSESEVVMDDSTESAAETEGATSSASPESVAAAAAPLPVEPEQPGEEEKGTSLDPEISQVDTLASGSTEGHREQAEPSGRKESEPEESS